MVSICIDADVQKLSEVMAFIDQQMEEKDVSMKVVMQMEIAVEEIFVNVASYAYAPDKGMVTIEVDFLDNPSRMQVKFIDNGYQYDPLAKEDPDVTLAASERQIGGLGIFMVKKSMDSMTYEYKDQQNILILEKNL